MSGKRKRGIRLSPPNKIRQSLRPKNKKWKQTQRAKDHPKNDAEAIAARIISAWLNLERSSHLILHRQRIIPLSDTEAVELELYVGLSVKQMDKLRHFLHRKRPGLVPSRDNTRAQRNKTGMKAEVINESMTYDVKEERIDLSMNYVSLRDSLIADIKGWAATLTSSKGPKHMIKIGGDIRDKNPYTRTVTSLMYAWAGIPNGDRDINHGLLATAWVAESPEMISLMARRLRRMV
jgi:hypothetical protein